MVIQFSLFVSSKPHCQAEFEDESSLFPTESSSLPLSPPTKQVTKHNMRHEIAPLVTYAKGGDC